MERARGPGRPLLQAAGKDIMRGDPGAFNTVHLATHCVTVYVHFYSFFVYYLPFILSIFFHPAPIFYFYIIYNITEAADCYHVHAMFRYFYI